MKLEAGAAIVAEVVLLGTLVWILLVMPPTAGVGNAFPTSRFHTVPPFAPVGSVMAAEVWAEKQ
jgi:hypothetical protein